MSKERELLSRALEALEAMRMVELMQAGVDEIPEEIRAYLDSESEEETIETLKAENFKLASGQCTEGGPWGDEGGSPYCKYTRPESAEKR